MSISDQKKVILIENNLLKKLCTIFIFFICFAAPLFAQSYACKLKQNGYAHALNALGGSQNQKLEYAKAWMPEQFTVNANYLEFYNFEPLEITGGNRESDFQANFNTSKYRVSYKVHINQNILVQEKYTFHRKTIRELGLLYILALKLIHQLQKRKQAKTKL
ncbi:MAG: hypothetical protein ACJ0DF_13610 [Paracoccaceae bacterium]